MSMVIFVTFGLQNVLCPTANSFLASDAVLNQSDHTSINYRDDVVAFGLIYDFNVMSQILSSQADIALNSDWHGVDITSLFRYPGLIGADDTCSRYIQSLPPCSVPNKLIGSPALAPPNNVSCPAPDILKNIEPKGRVSLIH